MMSTEKPQTAQQIADLVRQARAEYYGMVEAFCPAVRLPAEQICVTLGAAGKTEADLIADVLTAETRAPQPGDSCPCGGRAVIYCSKPQGDHRVQYLRCSKCRRAIGKRTIPESAVRPRPSRQPPPAHATVKIGEAFILFDQRAVHHTSWLCSVHATYPPRR